MSIPGLSDAGSKIEGKIMDIFGLADKPKTEKGRRLARVVMDLALAALSGILIYVFYKMGMLGGNPSITTLPMLALPALLGGVGLSWLIQDLTAKKYHRTIAKVASIFLPLLCAGAFIAMGMSPLHGGGVTPHLMGMANVYFSLGIPIGIGFTIFAAGVAVSTLRKKSFRFCKPDHRRRPLELEMQSRRELKAERQDALRRLSQDVIDL